MGAFSVWHFIVLAIVGAAFIGVYLYARSPKSEGDPKMVGVRGWLLFLVIGLIALGPLFNAANINAGIMETERLLPAVRDNPEWKKYTTSLWTTFFVVSALSIFTGRSLAKRREQKVVEFAKIALWIIGPVAAILMSILLPLLLISSWQMTFDAILPFIGTTISAAVWTAYLTYSKRVRATYGMDDPAVGAQ